MTIFSVLAISFPLAAQEQETEPQHKKEHHRYKLIDIGTFGGPASSVNPAVNGGPTISRHGTAVGSSATVISSNPATNGFFCSGLDGNLPFVFHAFKLEYGNVTDLGALPPAADNCSDALGVNAHGEIAGGSENGVIDPVLGVTEVRAVLWKDGGIKDLGTFGGNLSQATAINSRRQIVGFALNKIPDSFSMFDKIFEGPSEGTQTRAFLWEHEHMEDLGTLGGPDALGVFVNERGQVAGFSYTNSTPNPTTGIPTTDPFLWKNGRMIDIGSLGGTFGFPNDLNNRGQVVGQSNLAGDQFGDPFLWDSEKLTDLFTSSIGGNPLTAERINDSGEVVGAAAFPGRPFEAYLWRNGVATDLGTVGDDGCSWAHAINSRGQVVGQSFACDGSTGTTFLWEKGSMVDLNGLIPLNSNLHLVDAQAINDRGEIAGLGFPPGCTQDTQCGHAFLLIPCDEHHPDIEGCDYSRADGGLHCSTRQCHATPDAYSRKCSQPTSTATRRPLSHSRPCNPKILILVKFQPTPEDAR
jgi:probable HAF family extracellular repeat protein